MTGVRCYRTSNNKKIPAFAENPLHPFNFFDLLAEFACLL